MSVLNPNRSAALIQGARDFKLNPETGPDTARRYAEAGFRVMPGRVNDHKAPALSGFGAENPTFNVPSESFATANPVLILTGACPALGSDDLAVLDLDGDLTIPQVEAALGVPLPATLSSKGGRHLFYRVPPSETREQLRQWNFRPAGLELDLKWRGGYVLERGDWDAGFDPSTIATMQPDLVQALCALRGRFPNAAPTTSEPGAFSNPALDGLCDVIPCDAARDELIAITRKGWPAKEDQQRHAASLAWGGACAYAGFDFQWALSTLATAIEGITGDVGHHLKNVADSYSCKSPAGRHALAGYFGSEAVVEWFGLAKWCAESQGVMSFRQFQSGIKALVAEQLALVSNDVVELDEAEQRKLEAARMALEDGLSQLTVAEAFAAFDETIRWVDNQRHWLRYDGSRYRPCGDAAVMSRFNRLGPALGRKPGKEDLFYGAEAGGVLKRTKSLVAIRSDDLDRNADELVFQDVRLDLRTGATVKNGPDSLVTRALPWKFEAASAESRKALATFLDSFELGEDVLSWLRRVLGCAAAGRINREKLFLNLYGDTDRGKSTLIEMVHRSLGCYFATPSSKLLMTRAKDAGGHTDDLMVVPGARFWWSDETQRGDRLNSQMIKNMTNGTGSAVVRLSAKGAPGINVPVTWLVALTTNWIVKIDSDDSALLERQKIIKFEKAFAKDPTFIARTHPTIHPALIEWLMLGARESVGGLGADPSAVVKACQENAREQDWLGQVVDELFEPDTKNPTASIPYAAIQLGVATALRSTGRGDYKVTSQALGRVLTAKGYKKNEETKARMGIRRIAGT